MFSLYIVAILLVSLAHSSLSSNTLIAARTNSTNELNFNEALEIVRSDKTLNSMEKLQIINALYERIHAKLRKNDLVRQRARERAHRIEEQLEKQRQQERAQQLEQENQIYQKYLASRTGSSVLKDFYVQRY